MLNKIKRWFKKNKWNISNYIKKNEHILIPKKYLIIHIFTALSFILSYFFILKLLNIISFDFSSFKIIQIIDIPYQDLYKDLVISQIGSTFLTTAILSLVSSIEDKHILGEKTTIVLFGKKLLKFYLPMFIIYFLMIINIIFVINQKHSNILIALFILSIMILIYIITKIGSIFVSTQKYISLLYAKYYKECEKNIINDVAPRDYEAELLQNLKEETLKLISNNNVSYVKNINMYKILIDRLLFNIPKDLQKYHLDMTYAPSIINDFIEIIEHFIYFKDLTRAIQYYSWLLSRLNFHNVYITHNGINHIFEDLANKIMDFQNEYETIGYLEKLAYLITNIEIQQYYALTNDFSYTHFSDLRIKYLYHYDCKYFEIIYSKLYNNKYLSKKEKINCYTEIYDIFRMSAHNGCNIIRDITNFSFEFKEAKERKMPPCIMGQATAFLLLRTLHNRDERSFRLFLGMNIEANEMCFAIHIMLLSLIQIEKNKLNDNIYSDFYKMDFKFCKDTINNHLDKIFKDNKLWDGKLLINHLKDSYDYIYENCTENEKNSNVLFINYMFKFDKNLINQYFKKISQKYSIKLTINNTNEKNYNNIISTYINN